MTWFCPTVEWRGEKYDRALRAITECGPGKARKVVDVAVVVAVVVVVVLTVTFVIVGWSRERGIVEVECQ